MKSSKTFAFVFLVSCAVAMGLGARFAGSLGAAFGLFALLSIGGGLVCLFERSVVRSAFALLSTFLGTAGLFLLLGSDFLALAQVLIYVGGILALLLFGVMLTPPDLDERSLPRILIALGAAGAVVGLAAWRCASIPAFTRTQAPQTNTSDAAAIGVAFLDPSQYVVAFEFAAVFLTVALVAAVAIARRSDAPAREESR